MCGNLRQWDVSELGGKKEWLWPTATAKMGDKGAEGGSRGSRTHCLRSFHLDIPYRLHLGLKMGSRLFACRCVVSLAELALRGEQQAPSWGQRNKTAKEAGIVFIYRLLDH